MKYVIDTDKLLEHDLTLDELLYLIALSFNVEINDSTIVSCHNKDFITKEYNPITGHSYAVINKTGTDKLEAFFADCEVIPKGKKDRYEELAIKLRELFPSGKKEGTNYYWKDSIKIIANKLKVVTKQYGEFTDEQAIDATKRYVESFNGNYTYMQLLKYFISKREAKNGEIVENSQLMSYIENAGQDNYNNNWTAELK
jgi:hypothetical protein